jgi:hypothetical protein
MYLYVYMYNGRVIVKCFCFFNWVINALKVDSADQNMNEDCLF